MKKINLPFDRADFLITVGLATVGYGAWQIFPPASFIVVGAVILILGIFR